MHLYFFDLDDTICNTKKIVDEFIEKNNIDVNVMPKETLYDLAGKYIREVGFHNIEPLNNSTFLLLKQLIEKNQANVFYITARPSESREESVSWLKKHNLYLGEEKLIMDTEGIKGKTINNILSKKEQEFAFLFDDLEDNHLEASKYKNIISCLPY